MIKKNEIVKHIFGESSVINNSNESINFLKQILEADVKNFKLNITSYGALCIWENGVWIDGTWNNGTWNNGTWKNGTWGDGTWYDGTWHNGIWKHGVWGNGIWKNGIWKYGLWKNGTWSKGTWIKGEIWNPETKTYIISNISPNRCKWSLSYGK